ncbi:MAG: guanylate kinase [Propionibacteriaceae bacterium]|nr:guanylate kinase [Propionibacteriaceae bacterium]
MAGLRRRYPAVLLSVSATTRPPRVGEVDGVSYHFVTDDQFDTLVASDGLLEWAEYAGTRYGTPRQPVLDALAKGETMLLEIDLVGARQIRASFPDALQVFIAPPSWQELERRLRDRGAENETQMADRLARAKDELAAEGEFDAVIINDDVDEAVDKLVELLGLGGRALNRKGNL